MSPLYARLVVGLRVLVPLAWIAAAVAATLALPPLGDTGSAPLDDLVSGGGEAAQQQQSATQRFGFPLYTDTLVVQHDPGGLPPGTRERDARAALAVRQRQTPDLPHLRLVLPISDPKVTTAVNYLFFDDSANLDERRDGAERYASRQLGGVAVVGTTGAAPARLAQYEEIQSALPLVEAASVALILLIVGLAFRSLGASLVTLFTAGIAYAIAIRVLPWAGERTGSSVPAEVEPIIVVLLLGLVTDYSVFFLSETRRRLRLGQTRLDAVRAATARTAPIVFTAGLIVAAGTGALVVGKLGFFRAFGPGLALTTVIALAVSITLVPALIGLFGERLFGGRLAPAGPVPDEITDTREIERARRAAVFTRPVLALRRIPPAGGGDPDQHVAAPDRPRRDDPPRRAGHRGHVRRHARRTRAGDAEHQARARVRERPAAAQRGPPCGRRREPRLRARRGGADRDRPRAGGDRGAR